MPQKLENIQSSLSTQLSEQNNSETHVQSAPILHSVFDCPEIQTTLSKTKLNAEQLTHPTNLKKIPTSTKRIKPLNDFLGQDRARASVEAGISLPYSGYNIFAVGTAGLGKRTMVKRL